MKEALQRSALRIACIILSLCGCLFIGLDGAASIPGLSIAIYIVVFGVALFLAFLSISL